MLECVGYLFSEGPEGVQCLQKIAEFRILQQAVGLVLILLNLTKQQKSHLKSLFSCLFLFILKIHVN